MKKPVCILFACAFLFPAPVASADGPLPALPRFPVQRLEEARRALDAARGDAAAVAAWLAQGKDPDVQGEFAQVSTIESESLPRLFEVLTGSAAPGWVDAVAFSRVRGDVVLLYQGMTLQEAFRELGIGGDFKAYSYSDSPDAPWPTFRISDTVQMDAGPGGLVLRTPYGSFEFSSPWGWSPGTVAVNGSEPLSEWSVSGVELKVQARDDGHLAILAVAPREGNGQSTLVVHGIPAFNPLYCAVARGRLEVIEMLIAAGASTGAAGLGGDTALHTAARWGRADSADALLAAGMDVDARGEGGVTPLMAAVEGLPREQVTARVENKGGWAQWLLEAGPDMRPAILGTGAPQEDPAAAGSMVSGEMALFLLSRGADPAIRAENGETVLFHASRRGMLPLVEKLVERGVDLDARDANGETAVFAAVRGDQRRVLELLLDRGASARPRNRRGESPRAVAAKLRSTDCMAFFLSRQPVHVTVGPSLNSSWSSIDGYIIAGGMGGALDVNVRLTPRFTLTAEAGYTQRQIFADTIDPWLTSTEGEPYFQYRHVELSCMLDFSMLQLEMLWLSAVAGLGWQVQTSAFILTDSGLWDPIDIGSQLESSGLNLVLGVGLNGFLPRGTLLGIEGRYLRTLSGKWTGQGGGMGSLVLLFRVGV